MSEFARDETQTAPMCPCSSAPISCCPSVPCRHYIVRPEAVRFDLHLRPLTPRAMSFPMPPDFPLVMDPSQSAQMSFLIYIDLPRPLDPYMVSKLCFSNKDKI